MRQLLFILFVITLFISLSISCKGQNNTIEKNRELLKEYFLYSCIRHGFENINLSEIDHSGAVYIDLLRYDLKALHKTDSLAKVFVSSIETSDYEERNTKGVIILSIEKYKSPELKRFIKTMDKYLLKD